MTFVAYLEGATTPIYNRIATAMGRELIRHGCKVFLIQPSGFNAVTYRDFLSAQSSCVYISNASSGIFQSQSPWDEKFFFEYFPGRLVFLHQDIILGGASVVKGIDKLRAWQRVAHRSLHLCIESANVKELQCLGIENVMLVPHATEIIPRKPTCDDFHHKTSFVGHVTPSQYRVPGSSTQLQLLIDSAYTRRMADFGCDLDPIINEYVEQLIGKDDAGELSLFKIAYSHWIRSQISNQSMAFRGWCLENSNIQFISIFGGDPAYLHGITRKLKIERGGLQYYDAVYDPEVTERIFNKSIVSVNISSMQFDSAVVNRVHDVYMSGGLCLTDFRSGLSGLTSHWNEISFRTLDEFQYMVKYFSDPKNLGMRSKLIELIQSDIALNSGYHILSESMFRGISKI